MPVNTNAKTKEQKEIIKKFGIAYPEYQDANVAIQFGSSGLSYKRDEESTGEFTLADFNELLDSEVAIKLGDFMAEVNTALEGVKLAVEPTPIELQKLFAEAKSVADVVKHYTEAKPAKGKAKPVKKKNALSEARQKRDAAKLKEGDRKLQQDAQKKAQLREELSHLAEQLGDNLTTEVSATSGAYEARIEKGRILTELIEKGKELKNLGDPSFVGKGLQTYIGEIADRYTASKRLAADSANIAQSEVSKMTNVWRAWFIDGSKSGTFKADGMMDGKGKLLSGTHKLSEIDPEKLYMTARYVTPSNLDKLASFLATQPRSIIKHATSLFDSNADNVADVIATLNKVIHSDDEAEPSTKVAEHVAAELIKLGKDKPKPENPSLKTLKVPVAVYNGFVNLANRLAEKADADQAARLFGDAKPLDVVLEVLSSSSFDEIIVGLVRSELITKEEAALLIS